MNVDPKFVNRLINLVKSVEATEFSGIKCRDVEGGTYPNWFEEREALLHDLIRDLGLWYN